MWIVDHELTTQAMCQILQHYGTRDQQQPSNVVGLGSFVIVFQVDILIFEPWLIMNEQ